MEKNYFYVIDQVDNKQFIVEWYPGHENLGDYILKHHEEKHHKEVRNIGTPPRNGTPLQNGTPP